MHFLRVAFIVLLVMVFQNPLPASELSLTPSFSKSWCSDHDRPVSETLSSFEIMDEDDDHSERDIFDNTVQAFTFGILTRVPLIGKNDSPFVYDQFLCLFSSRAPPRAFS